MMDKTWSYNSSKAEQILKGKYLVIAAGKGQHKELLRLLKSGASVDADEYNKALFYASQNYITPLQKACENNRVQCVKTLISFGADVNARDRFDVTALHMAAQHGHYQCLKVLLDAGAECSIPTKHSKKGCYTATPHLGGTTALHLAAGNNNVNCVRELILSGSDYNAIDEKGRTSLYVAAESKLEECVLVHLKSAVGRDILSLPGFESGDTPLHFAVRCGMVECVKVLLNLGSDPNHLNHSGMSPLHDAVVAHSVSEDVLEEIVQLLVLKGYNTDVNLRDGAGYTPLHYVTFNTGMCMSRRPNLACFLLSYGANPKIHNPRGYNVIESEIKNSRNDSAILRAVLKTYLSPPNLNMMKLLLPTTSMLTPPVHAAVGAVHYEDGGLESAEIHNLESRRYTGIVRAKCLWYVSMCQKPRTLQHICRFHIRQALGYKNLRRIRALPLPKKLQQYLLFQGAEEFVEA